MRENLFDGVRDFVLEGGWIERKNDRAAAVNVGFGGSGFGGKARTQVRQRSTGDFKEQLAIDARSERRQPRLPQKLINRRDLAKQVGFGHGCHGEYFSTE